MCGEVFAVIKNKGWDIIKSVKLNVWDPYMGFEKKAEILKRKTEQLISRRKDIMDAVKYAELHSSKKRKAEVDNWKKDVEKLENKLELFEQDVQQSSKGLSRICLSNRADDIVKEVESLVEESKFPEGLFLNVNDEYEYPLIETQLKGHAFEENLREVLRSLGEVSSIGIYGMAGVGKTTLATHIHDHLLINESTFSGHVRWIDASNDFNITKMQNNIAETLGLDLSTCGDNDLKRRAKLSKCLMKMKNFVLILDDVWINFNVNNVGIPLEIGGGTLIITSRSVEVCDGVSCQKKIKVETLSPIESKKLFMETLDHSGDLPMEIAERMMKKCDGLPLGIIVMAASMRGKNDFSEWRVAFEKLTKSCMKMENMTDKVLPILQRSYDRLISDPTLQKCFLYCCLYPEEYKIERDELIRLFIVEELLVKRNSRKENFDEGHAVLNRLERVCLLESVLNDRGERCVKMHNLVREMAMEIAREEFKWMVKAGAELQEIQWEKECSEDLDKVSLMHNNISQISQPLSRVCPRLTTLSLRGNGSLTQLVDPFFAQMLGLRIVDLSYTSIRELPSSVSNLESLSALLLRGCRRLRFMLPLNKIKNLIELDLYGAIDIDEVPQGLENLVNLRYLDMRGNRRAPFKQPAADILATLSNLQILSIPFGIREEDLQGMRQLEVFYGEFVDVCSFNGFVKHQVFSLKPSLFEIVLHMKKTYRANIGGVPKGNRVTLDVLVFTGEHAGILRWDAAIESVVVLPQCTQELVISNCEFRPLGNNLLDAIPSMIWVTYMRKIEIHYCNGIEFLIRLRNSVSEGILGPLELAYLEELSLHHLKGFTGLVKMELGDLLPSAETFFHLRRLELYRCDKIKKLIPKWLLQYLLNLTEISVNWCKKMEEIISEDDDDDDDDDDDVILPKLLVLNLSWLPKLKSIYKGRMSCDSIQSITFRHCGNPKRLPFILPLINGQPSAPPALEQIKMTKSEWESLEWDHPQFKNLLLPFVKH